MWSHVYHCLYMMGTMKTCLPDTDTTQNEKMMIVTHQMMTMSTISPRCIVNSEVKM